MMENKHFVAIGKIVFDTPGYPWNIPHTHFMINKTASGLYEATNLELILDSIGNTIEEAAEILANLTTKYIMEIMMKRRGHDELTEVVDTSTMEDYWREYRKIEVELSRTKNDLSHNLDRHWIAAIKETMDDSLKEIIYGIAKEEAEAVYTALRNKIPESISVRIECKTLKAAA
jgi:hypothetical protein